MTKKFTEQELQQLENEQELEIYDCFFCADDTFQADLFPALDEREKWEIKEGRTSVEGFIREGMRKAKERKIKLEWFLLVVPSDEISKYEKAVEKVKEYFVGQEEDRGKNRTVYDAFVTYTDLTVNALRLFRTQWISFGGFGGGSVEQLFAASRLGLYTALEYCVLGRRGLNYPDLGTDDSPRLKAVWELARLSYFLRSKLRALKIYLEFQEDIPGYQSQDQWSNFLEEVQKRLKTKFGTNSDKIFRKIFGSNNPPAPTSQKEFNYYQEQILTWIAKVAVVEGDPDQTPINIEEIPIKDDFHKNYAQEQQKREEAAQQKEEQEKREDFANISEEFRRNYELKESWKNKGFDFYQTRDWISVGLKPQDAEFVEWLTDKGWSPEKLLNEGDEKQLRKEFKEYKINNKEPKPTEEPKKSRSKSPSKESADKPKTAPPPKTYEFNGELNDILNSLTEGLREDTEKQKNNDPQFDGSLPPINSMTKEDRNKMPWLVVNFNLWDYYEGAPYWYLRDPSSVPWRHGSGDLITMCLWLEQVVKVPKYVDDPSPWFHQLYWNRGDENTKGFKRLVLNTDWPDNSREKEREHLLIPGFRKDDPRADKLGWKSLMWSKDGSLQFGVPGVEQVAYRFTRVFNRQGNAYEVDGDHFIGLLRKKKVMGTSKAVMSSGLCWGTAPKDNFLWITNQLNFPYSENMNWKGQDVDTINPGNGYSHYLLFCPMGANWNYKTYITNPNPSQNCSTLAELVGKLIKEGAVLVRLGPDALELIESQTPQQKAITDKETDDSRTKNRKKITDELLQKLGISREEFEDIFNTPYSDPTKRQQLLKKVCRKATAGTLTEALNLLYQNCQPETREAIFDQLIETNPLFNSSDQQTLKTRWKDSNDQQKQALFNEIISGNLAKTLHASRSQKEKQKIFEDQVNQNPAYGPPGEDTQERRDRFKEYNKASATQKEALEKEENERFTQAQNAHQWSQYFTANADRQAGAGDQTVGTESDNNWDGNFSFKDSLAAINKLKNLAQVMPPGMQEGMVSNKPYWEVVFHHPLTYIFIFIGVLIAIMAATLKKNN